MSIDDYLRHNPKNKLVFTKNEFEDFVFTNLGLEMATRLQGHTAPSVIASETFDSVIAKGLIVHPKYGKYVAIKNIGILFEPSLRLNVHMLFESISHDTLLVVCSDGIVKNDTLYFTNPTDGFGMPLSGLSYLVIE